MKIAAIICEFNPFSKGHKYLIDSVRQELNPDAVICIMSGNFVQRGEIAYQNKWDRAKDALEGEADLVVQLPVRISLSSAKYFAKGGVQISKALGANYLCFGSTSGDLNILKKLSKEGIEDICDGNDILACEYLRVLGKSILPYTVKIDQSLGHASDIRSKQNKDYENTLFQLLKYKILESSENELSKASEVSEGLENRIKDAIKKANNLDELVLAIKSKRYTYTRISRCLMQILLGLNKSTISEPYINVLGFNNIGAKILKNAKCPVYSGIKPSNTKENKVLHEDVICDDIYNGILGNDLYKYSDYVCKPYRYKI